MKNKYRVVKDNYLGFEAQVKYWWFPFIWFQIRGVNTSTDMERAEAYCRAYAANKNVVSYLGKL